MPINLMAGALSAIFLRSRGLPDDKMFAGAALSAMTPGVLGLAIPLALANQQPSGGSRDTDGDAEVVHEMPNVIGRREEEAKKSLSPLGLSVTVKRVTVAGSEVVATPGTVIWQEPPARAPVSKGGKVLLHVQVEAQSTDAG